MGREIERKFLVQPGWRPPATGGVHQRQGYLSVDPDRVVRVRRTSRRAWLTIKGRGRGIVRSEFEYPIPGVDAEAMLQSLCIGAVVEKTRYRIRHGGRVWEVDVFDGANAGLVVAEIELESPDAVPRLPHWVGEEVSSDPRYLVVNLAQHPFRAWSHA
jgi:adenylate cyclase